MGPAEVLQPSEVPDPIAGAGELVVEVGAAGVNFLDVRQRRGTTSDVPVPFVPGIEGSGTVVEVGPGVSEFALGDRVAWNMSSGSYAERVVVKEVAAVPVPDAIDDLTAAAVMTQGLTSHNLAAVATRLLPQPSRVLVHAAAGGVGSLLTQTLTRQGHYVVGVVSSPAKVSAASFGATEVVVSSAPNVEEELVQRFGEGTFDAVYDGVGADTFEASLRLVRPEGVVVYFGQASGPVPPVNLWDLPKEHSGDQAGRAQPRRTPRPAAGCQPRAVRMDCRRHGDPADQRDVSPGEGQRRACLLSSHDRARGSSC